MRIIGFGPFHRTGKDTAVKFALSYMKQTYPDVKCARFSLGDTIRDLAFQLYEWAGVRECAYYLNKPEEKDVLLATIGKTQRQICVELGESLYTIHKRTLFELTIKDCTEDILFWPDVYRLSEIDYLWEFAGTYVKMIRPGYEGQSLKIDVIPPDYHPDVLIVNDGTLKELNQKIKKLCDMVVQ